MNEQFYELPQEKQLRIINAGLEVFSKNDYRHAVTDEIARKAGISKGLLFYYFHNKKSLYLYLFDYCASLSINQVMGDGPGGSGDEPASGGNESGGQAARWETVTDFFELLEMAAEAKIKVLEKTPYLADFMVRGYYSEDGIVKEDLNRATMEAVSSAFRKYFRNVDYSKFKPDVPPMEIYEMLVWMTEGYLHDRRKSNASISMKEIMEKFYVWEKWLKQIAYKEEYQKTEA